MYTKCGKWERMSEIIIYVSVTQVEIEQAIARSSWNFTDEEACVAKCCLQGTGKTSRTLYWGHSLKLIKKYNKGNTRHHFFTERVVSRWNSLPQEAVCAPSINAFKSHLTRIRNTKMGFFKDC